MKKRGGDERQRWRESERGKMGELGREGSEMKMTKTINKREGSEGEETRQERQRRRRSQTETKKKGRQLCFSTGTSAVTMRRSFRENFCKTSNRRGRTSSFEPGCPQSIKRIGAFCAKEEEPTRRDFLHVPSQTPPGQTGSEGGRRLIKGKNL